MIRRLGALVLLAPALLGCSRDDAPRETAAGASPRPATTAREAHTGAAPPVATTTSPPSASTRGEGGATTSDRPTTTGATTSDRPTTTGARPAATPPPYRLGPTRRCLLSKGATVSTIGAGEGRLRELGDLAQRTSLQVELDGRTAAVAIGNGELLRSLLRAPNDPYELDVERNALLMYRGASAPVAALVRDCLRP